MNYILQTCPFRSDNASVHFYGWQLTLCCHQNLVQPNKWIKMARGTARTAHESHRFCAENWNQSIQVWGIRIWLQRIYPSVWHSDTSLKIQGTTSLDRWKYHNQDNIRQLSGHLLQTQALCNILCRCPWPRTGERMGHPSTKYESTSHQSCILRKRSHVFTSCAIKQYLITPPSYHHSIMICQPPDHHHHLIGT